MRLLRGFSVASQNHSRRWRQVGGPRRVSPTTDHRPPKITRDRNNQNILALEITSAKSSLWRARWTHRSPKKTIQRFTQRSVKFIRWLKNHLNTWRTWGQALLASTHLIPQTKEAGITNAGTTGFPLNPLGLFGSEFDIRARAHPPARHGADKIFPTKMATSRFMFV